MDCFGELLYSFGYREKLVGLYGFGLGGSPYPAQALPMWQKFFQRMKKQVFGFMLRKSEPMLAIFTQPSSVTKRNIMDGMCKVRDMAYTPHQCSYSDRKGFPLGENHPYGPGLLECPWSEILPSVTLTKRYDPIWSHPGGCSTLHQVPVVVKSGKICPYVSVAVDGEKSNNSSCIVPWDCISNSHH